MRKPRCLQQTALFTENRALSGLEKVRKARSDFPKFKTKPNPTATIKTEETKKQAFSAKAGDLATMAPRSWAWFSPLEKKPAAGEDLFV